MNLLFGEDKWVMYPLIGRTLGRFHHVTGRWIYPPLDEEMKALVVEEV